MSARKQRKVRFSDVEPVELERTLLEIMEMAQMYQENGHLSQLEETHADYLQEAAMAFSRKAKTSLTGAKRVLKLIGMLHNEPLVKFLKTADMLTIFSEETFTKSNGTIAQSGGALCLELLEALVNGKDPKKHETTLQRRKRLNALVLDYDAEARDTCVVVFFKIVSVIATLCSFIAGPCDEMEPDMTRIVDILSRCLSKKWLSASLQKVYQKKVSLPRMVDGWILVNEVIKVQLQELWYAERKEQGDVRTAPKVSRSKVLHSLHHWCNHVIAEFGAWIYSLLHGRVEKTEFITAVGGVLHDISHQLMVDVDSEAFPSLPTETLSNAIDQVDSGGPTMSQVRYEAMSLRPVKRISRISVRSASVQPTRMINWSAKEVLMRCRWNGSPAEQKYTAFLQGPEFKQSLEAVPDTPGLVIPETPLPNTPLPDAPLSEFVPGTPATVPEAPSRKRPLSPRSRQRELKERLQVLREMNMKRLKVSQVPQEGEKGERSSVDRLRGASSSNDVAVFEAVELHNDGSDVEDDDSVGKPGRSIRCADQRPRAAFMEKREQLSKNLNASLQSFYADFLNWPPIPSDPNGPPPMSEGSNILTANEEWVRRFVKSRKSVILSDVNSASNIAQYQNHWKAMICLELRGAITQEIHDRFPKLLENPLGVKWVEDVEQQSFVKVRIDDISASRSLLNLKCTSMDLDLNMRIVKELQGGTLCLGYVQMESGGSSELSLIACRRVHYPREAVTPNGEFSRIDFINVSLALSKSRFSLMNVRKGDFVFLMNGCSFSPYMRMYKTMEQLGLLPMEMQRRLFGPNVHVPLQFGSIQALEATVDHGCLQYLRDVKETTSHLDDSQYKAILTLLSNFGSCADGSSSMSNVQGPPGTGKTTLILVLIGALMHHSAVGHVGRPENNQLKGLIEKDKFTRCSTNPNGIRIQVCCPSNQGVDNILLRMDKHGIPDGKGGKLYPQCARIARDLYQYGPLLAYSIDEKAKPFDIHGLDLKNRGRMYASNAAKKLFAREAIVIFGTTSTAGSARMRQLKIPFGYTIIDEAAQSWEPEDLIPCVGAANDPNSSYNHVSRIGDHLQLKPISNAQHIVTAALSGLWFNYAHQMNSLFERLHEQGRCSSEMLTFQYRMHPTIAKNHFPTFYDTVVHSALPAPMFDAPYNRGRTEKGGFSPLTVIDTSEVPDRFETKIEEGKYVNYTEQQVIVDTLLEIRELLGGSLDSLVDQIAILLPYRSSIDFLRKRLDVEWQILREPRMRDGILINTVDSMQGSQRHVIIFGGTRSNLRREIGFLDKTNRLNVAFSRGQRLVVIIGDMSTLSQADSSIFSAYHESCRTGSHGALLMSVRDEGVGRKTLETKTLDGPEGGPSAVNN